MDTISPFHWLIFLAVWVALFGFPVAKILQRLGLSRWWTILAFVPLINLFALWALSVARWPKVDAPA